MSENRILDISWGTILKISAAVIGFYVLYLIRDLLIWFIFAVTISILFDPIIDFLQRKRVPRGLAVAFVYLSAFGFLALAIFLTAPLFVAEINQFAKLFPQYFEKISPSLRGLGMDSFDSLESFTIAFGKTFEGMTGNVFDSLFSVFGGIFSTIFVITIAIFLSLEEKSIEKTMIFIFPKKHEAYASRLWEKCQKKVSSWFGIRLLGSVFVGVTCYIALVLFNVVYPLSLALMAGALEIIPVIGPLVAGAIVFLFVSADSMLKATFVLLFFVLIQQIEGNVLTPVLTKKLIGLPPALVLVALAIGGELWGIAGAVLTIPLFGLLFEFLKDFLKKRKEEEAVSAQ